VLAARRTDSDLVRAEASANLGAQSHAASCSRHTGQAGQGSNPLTGSQFSGSSAFASTLIVERRRVVTSCCQSTSLP
jgi:hypothetical protein